MLEIFAHPLPTHADCRIGVSSGIFLFNEPLKQYWEQKEDRDAAGVDASKVEPIAGDSSTIEDGKELTKAFELGHPKK